MCYWEDVTCVLWSCSYGRAVIRSCLPAWEKASWRERREKWRGAGEKETTDKSQHQENITAICFIFLLNKSCLHVFYDNTLLCQTSPFKEKSVYHLTAEGSGFICWLCRKKSSLSSSFTSNPPHSFLLWWSLTCLIWWINEKWEISWHKGQPTVQAWGKEWENKLKEAWWK